MCYMIHNDGKLKLPGPLRKAGVRGQITPAVVLNSLELCPEKWGGKAIHISKFPEDVQEQINMTWPWALQAASNRFCFQDPLLAKGVHEEMFSRIGRPEWSAECKFG